MGRKSQQISPVLGFIEIAEESLNETKRNGVTDYCLTGDLQACQFAFELHPDLLRKCIYASVIAKHVRWRGEGMKVGMNFGVLIK